MTDEIQEACLIEVNEFTDEEKSILEQIEVGNLEPAILMLSVYKGKNYFLFDEAFSKLIELDMLYEFVHLYRTRSTVGDMK